MLRLFLIAVFCAGFVAPALAGAAKWQTPDTYITTYKPFSGTYSAGDKTVTDKFQVRVAMAVDFSAKRAWIRSSKLKRWWDGATADTDIASVTGYDLSGMGTQAIRFIMRFGKASGTGCSVKIHTTASAIETPIPSGFSAWDDIVGTTAINTGTVVAATVSESDKAAATTGSPNGYGLFETTGSLALGSTGKAMIEVEFNYFSTDVCARYDFGLAGSSFTFPTDNMHSSVNSVATYSESGASYWYYNGSWVNANSSYFLIDSASTDPASFYRMWVSTQALPATKTYWEVTLPSSGTQFVGMVPTVDAATPWLPAETTTYGHVYPGRTGDQVGLLPTSGTSGCFSNSTPQTCNVAATTSYPRTIAVAFDSSAQRIWFGHDQSGSFTWYGSAGGADPATGTNGLVTTGGNFGTGPYYPAVAMRSGQAATINGGSTAFTYSIPSGFSQLDTPSGGNRGFIFGENDNWPEIKLKARRVAAAR